MTPTPSISATSTRCDRRPVMLVTGSAKRIGAAIVRAAHHAGYRVIIHALSSQSEAYRLADTLNQTRPDSAAVLIADLAVIEDSDALQGFVQDALSPFGQIDVLVHNASRFYPTAMGTITHSAWNELMLTNAKAPLLLSQALLPYLQAVHGCIISVLDIHADDRPFVGYSVYNMAKSAHRTMVQSLALELAPTVRVNGIAPGVNVLPDPHSDQAISNAQQAAIVNSIPMQRIGTPDDIADCVLYLARASYITGEVIAVDGGRSLTLAGGHMSV
ncbi:pteridine reductase [Psychrobacter aestuarii]|nr:pteridine reductase [Psychrobacter aestuarii]